MSVCREKLVLSLPVAIASGALLFAATLAPHFAKYVGYGPLVSGTALFSILMWVRSYRLNDDEELSIRFIKASLLAAVGATLFFFAAMFILLNTQGS